MGERKLTVGLSTAEVDRAMTALVPLSQRAYFAKELADLKGKNAVCKTSKILDLSPYLDNNNDNNSGCPTKILVNKG